MSSPHILVPFFPPRAHERHILALGDALGALSAAGYGNVTVYCRKGELPGGVGSAVVRIVEAGMEPASPMVPGWLAAVRDADDGRNVIVLDYRCREVPHEAIQSVAEILDRGKADVVFGVAEAEDHPCQFNYLCDVESSHPFIPVDVEAEAEGYAPMFPDGANVAVSTIFPFRWDEWAKPGVDANVFEVLPGAHSVRPVVHEAGKVFSVDTVLLVRESAVSARQVSVEPGPTAAVPLFMRSADAGIRIETADGGWKVQAGGDFAQLYPLIRKEGKAFSDAAMRLHPLCHSGDEKLTETIFPVQGAFLVNVYRHAESSCSDIEFPYVSSRAPWSTSLDGLERLHEGRTIHGRQAFPRVLEFSGALLGMSGRACNDPLSALASGSYGHVECTAVSSPVLVHDPSPSEPLAPARPEKEDTGPSRRPIPAALRTGLLFAAARTLVRACGTPPGALSLKPLSVFERKTRDACALSRNPVLPKGVVAHSRTLPGLEDILEKANCGKLELSWKDDFRHTVKALDAIYARYPGMGNLYAKIAAEHCLLRPNHAQAAELFALEEEKGWMSSRMSLNHAEALAGAGRLEEAVGIVEKAYAANGALKNGFARVAWNGCYVVAFDPKQALSLFERDAEAGRLEPNRASIHASFLAADGRLEEGLDLVRRTFDETGRMPSGGFARVGWEYHVAQHHDPSAMGRYFEMDERSGEPGFVIIQLAAMAYGGGLEAAKAQISQLYARGAKLKGAYSRVGLLHWLRTGDTESLVRCVEQDYRMGFSHLCHKLLLLRLVEHAAPGRIRLRRRLQNDIADDTDIAWKLLVQWLRCNGVSGSLLRDLIPDETIEYRQPPSMVQAQ